MMEGAFRVPNEYGRQICAIGKLGYNINIDYFEYDKQYVWY